MAAEVGAAETVVVVAHAASLHSWKIAPRSPTLGGTIPLRAAQACPPLLAGNAFGLALSLPGPLFVKRGLSAIEAGPRVGPPVSTARALDGATVELVVDTGLRVDDIPGAAIVVERCFNRRDLRVDVVATRVAAGESIVLRLHVQVKRGQAIELRGEMATLGLYVADPEATLLPLRSAPEVARAHATFFDARYFSGKRGAPTRKYQRAARGEPEPTPRPGPGAFVVQGGGAPPRIARGTDGVAAIVLPLEARTKLSFHGQRVEVEIDPEALARRARSIEKAFREALGDDVGDGALRYFTTYVSPHVSGDPHAFFKPATLVAAPQAWRLVVDGPDADGLEGLRGITEPAWFHAMPAVARILGREASPSMETPIVRARFTRAEWVSPRLALRGATDAAQ